MVCPQEIHPKNLDTTKQAGQGNLLADVHQMFIFPLFSAYVLYSFFVILCGVKYMLTQGLVPRDEAVAQQRSALSEYVTHSVYPQHHKNKNKGA